LNSTGRSNDQVIPGSAMLVGGASRGVVRGLFSSPFLQPDQQPMEATPRSAATYHRTDSTFAPIQNNPKSFEVACAADLRKIPNRRARFRDIDEYRHSFLLAQRGLRSHPSPSIVRQ
jgi:hypothetical protein